MRHTAIRWVLIEKRVTEDLVPGEPMKNMTRVNLRSGPRSLLVGTILAGILLYLLRSPR